MKTVIEMWHKAWPEDGAFVRASAQDLERFAELVRADERNSWPLEMEAMERQVNTLTDALAEERKSRAHSLGPGDMELILRRNHKDDLFECCRRFSAEEVMHGPDWLVEKAAKQLDAEMDNAIRARSNT